MQSLRVAVEKLIDEIVLSGQNERQVGLGVLLNYSRPEDVQRIVKQTVEQFSTVDVLVNHTNTNSTIEPISKAHL